MTLKFKKVFINNKYSLLSSNKFKPIVKPSVDIFNDDYYFKKRTVEEAEIEYQNTTLKGLLSKSNLSEQKISLLISSDLQNQNIASNFCASEYNIPFLGIYSACASFNEGLIIAANMVDNNKKNAIVTVSSHNLVSEKQFRFPIEYGAIRKKVNTCTCSGSISVLLSSNKSNIKIESSTIGKVIHTNHKDTNDMGSAMAPSAAETLYDHLKDTNRNANYYDVILTGDLGEYGSKIMNYYLKEKYNINIDNHIDCGSIFYSENSIFSGASGPLCLPLTLFDYFLSKKEYKKILIIATGSLHSTLSSNLSLPIPSISHAVSLEVTY